MLLWMQWKSIRFQLSAVRERTIARLLNISGLYSRNTRHVFEFVSSSLSAFLRVRSLVSVNNLGCNISSLSSTLWCKWCNARSMRDRLDLSEPSILALQVSVSLCADLPRSISLRVRRLVYLSSMLLKIFNCTCFQ